jgi:putative ABC transport system substrate-binding protein
MKHPALDDIYKGIQDELKAEGYGPSKLKIDYQNANADQSNLKTMSAKIAAGNPKVAIGIATPAAAALANTVKDSPVLFSAASDPVGSKLVSNTDKPGGNVSGVSDAAPLAAQLDFLKKVMPNAQTLGIIYTSSDDSGSNEAKKMQEIATNAGMTVKMFSITNTNDLNQVSLNMASDKSLDAVFLPTDNVIASAMPTLIKNTNAAKLPVFSTVNTLVEAGAVASNGINQYQIGRQTGKMIVKILKGEKVGDLPVDFMQPEQISINTKEAKELGLTIPEDIMNQAKDKGHVYDSVKAN